jgi:hypothetical protein
VISLRFEVTVGVDSSDVKQVMQILKAAVDSQMGVLKQPDPFIRFIWRFIIKFFNNFGRKNCFALKISRAK